MTTVAQTPIVIKSTAWAWGFEDGCQGINFYHGNDLFVGQKLTEWRQGWQQAQAEKARKAMEAEMLADLEALRSGKVQPIATADEDEISDEAIGEMFSTQPYLF